MMAPRKKRLTEIDALIERIQIAAKVAGVKPETVCFTLFRDRNLLPKLDRARARLITRRAQVEHYIQIRGGEPQCLGEADAK